MTMHGSTPRSGRSITARASRVWPVICLVLLCLSGCVAPGLYTLSSRMEGTVFMEGQPVPGAEIRFEAESAWFGENEPVVIRTDERGRFVIDAWRKASAGALYHQAVISQTLTIELDDAIYVGWRGSKMNYANNGELDRPLVFVCELDRPEQRYETNSPGGATGVCRPT